MEIPENAPKSVVEMVFIYDVAGKKTEFKEADLMSIPEGATFVERKDNVISEGYVPPIHDFTMELNGSDYKEELLVEPKLLIFVSYDLEKADAAGMKKLTDLYNKGKENGYKVIGMTGSTEENIAIAKKKYGLTFDFYFCDPTTLKTIERANPSIVVMEKGTITQKLHYNDSADLKL
jgi:hypothetical protein